MFARFRNMRQVRRLFERYSRDATDNTRIVMTLAMQHDIRPSVARELFAEYCHENPTYDWRTCGRHLMTTVGGMSWMTEQITHTPTPQLTGREHRSVD